MSKPIWEMSREEFDAMIEEEIKDSDEFHEVVIEFLKKIYPRAEWLGTEAAPYRGFIKISFTKMGDWPSGNRQVKKPTVKKEDWKNGEIDEDGTVRIESENRQLNDSQEG